MGSYVKHRPGDFAEMLSMATPRQAEYIEALGSHGNASAAAKSLGVCESSIRVSLGRLKMLAAARGVGSTLNPSLIPDGYEVRGTSTLVDEEGKPKIQWIKTSKTNFDLKSQVEDMVAHLADEVRGKAEPVDPPTDFESDTCTIYPIADQHLGLYAYGNESGDDWNSAMSSEVLLSAITRLVDGAPSSRVAVVAGLGDYFHADSSSNRTAKSGHPLDVDGRYHEVMAMGVDLMRGLIDACLAKHETVHVINVIGNHDEHSSIALDFIIAAYYSNEPRVIVDRSASKHKRFRFGKCLIAFTHGDTVKPVELPMIMADQWPSDWAAATAHRTFLHGHIHTQTKWEFRGCTIESFRTLTASDSWHTANGYKAGRDISRITYHKDWGEIERSKIGIAQIAQGINRSKYKIA